MTGKREYGILLLINYQHCYPSVHHCQNEREEKNSRQVTHIEWVVLLLLIPFADWRADAASTRYYILSAGPLPWQAGPMTEAAAGAGTRDKMSDPVLFVANTNNFI